MYPAPFRYHRAESVSDAVSMLAEFGEGARALAGGQTLLVLLKQRFDEPSDLVDLGRIPGLDGIEAVDGEVRIGALATHARIAASAVAASIPIVGDCANGIADNQVRSRGTMGGSLASGDPSCDWPALLHTLDARVECQGPGGSRDLDINGFVCDLYETVLEPGEIITGVRFAVPPAGSGGAYCVFKRAAPAYPTASVGVQLTLNGDTVENARVAMGSAGLTPIRSQAAEAELQGRALSDESIGNAAAAAAADSDPLDDQRGSPEFKRHVLSALAKRAARIAQRRAKGEQVENSHEYY